MTKVSDEYPGKPALSDADLKEVLAAKYSAGNTKSTNIEEDSTDYKFHTEVVTLPSKGLLYEKSNPLSAGTLEMKYMTAKEEDILTSQNLIKSGVVIDKLLQSMIVTKINYNDLLVGDKNALLVAARILSYGKDYDVEVTCPQCGEKSKHVIDLSAFEDKSLIDGTFEEGKNEFWFELPASKRRVSFKCLTSADEKAIENELKGLKKLSKITGVDSEMTTRLKYLITSIDGNSDINFIRKFIDSGEFLARDSFALRKHIQEVIPDTKMEFTFDCPNCGHEDLNMAMPMTVDFFWPRV